MNRHPAYNAAVARGRLLHAALLDEARRSLDLYDWPLAVEDDEIPVIEAVPAVVGNLAASEPVDPPGRVIRLVDASPSGSAPSAV